MPSAASDIEKSIKRRDENQFRYVLNVLYRRWYFVLLGALLGATVFGLVGLAKHERVTLYTAETQLDVRPSMWETIPLGPGAPPRAQALITNPRTIAIDIRPWFATGIAPGKPGLIYAPREEYRTSGDVGRVLQIPARTNE